VGGASEGRSTSWQPHRPVETLRAAAGCYGNGYLALLLTAIGVFMHGKLQYYSRGLAIQLPRVDDEDDWSALKSHWRMS
jgi:hypothetical protein